MKLAIRKAAVDPIQKMLGGLDKRHFKLKTQFPDDLKDILFQDKEWREMMETIEKSQSPEETREAMDKVSAYEKKKALTDHNFKELVAYKAQLNALIKEELKNLEAVVNGESENSFIRALERILFFGKPSTKKNSFFGLLFIILATTGIVGTTIGILVDQGLKDWFSSVGPFGIEFIKNLANGHEGFMNIASWYVAFELLGAKGMKLLRKPIIKINKPESKVGSRSAGYTKKNTYMIEQNLKHLKNNVQKILKYSEDPKFAPLMIGEHAWAVDHISVAAENIDQVADFLEVQFQDAHVAQKMNKKAAVAVDLPIKELVDDLINSGIVAFPDAVDPALHMVYKNRNYTLTDSDAHGWVVKDAATGEFNKMSGLSKGEIKRALKVLFDEFNVFDPLEEI